MQSENAVCSWCGEDLGVSAEDPNYEYEMEGHGMECSVIAAERAGL